MYLVHHKKGGVYTVKWNTLQNGSRDSTEGKSLGKFASACLKVDWNAAQYCTPYRHTAVLHPL